MKRNKGNNIVSFIIMFVIAALFLTSLFVWDSSQVGEGNVFEIKIAEDVDLFTAKHVKRIDGELYTYNGPLITDEVVNEVLDVGGVKKACLGTEVSVLIENIQLPGAGKGNWNYELEKKDAAKGYGAYYGSGYMVGSEDKYNVLRGYNDTKLIDYFRTDVFKLVEGKHITDADEHKVLISDELAELNGLTVGDTFTTELKLYDSLMGRVGATIMEVPLEVAGIFRVNVEQNLEGTPLKEDIAVNYMFVNNKTVREFDQMYRQIFVLEEEPVYTSAEFFVRNPLRLNGIMNKVQKLDLVGEEYFNVTAATGTEEDIVEAYQKINMAALVLTVWFAVMGTVLLIVLFKRSKVGKNSIVTLVIAIVLGTGVAFLGRGVAGNLMCKMVGLEATVIDEEGEEEVPLTPNELREYYEASVLKCNVVEAGDFQRDVSLVTMIAGEAVLVLMCGAAFVLEKKKIMKK